MRAYRGDFYQLSWCIYAHCTSLAVAFAKNAESERNLLVDASNLASRAVELEFSSNFGWLEPDPKHLNGGAGAGTWNLVSGSTDKIYGASELYK